MEAVCNFQAMFTQSASRHEENTDDDMELCESPS